MKHHHFAPGVPAGRCRFLFVVALALLAVFHSTARAQNLVTNGSFELPAYAGDGRAFYPTLDLIDYGWSYVYPTDYSSFFLEYGRYGGTQHYRDGRQALCLNGRGTPVSVWQTFPTVVSNNYVLTFAMCDIQGTNAPPSLAQLTVGVAGLTRVFSRTNDTGYVLKRWAFTAVSNLTTLTFTDTTPAFYPSHDSAPIYLSPFLDAVCVNPGGVIIVATDTTISNNSFTFTVTDLPSPPSYSGQTVTFTASDPGGQTAVLTANSGVSNFTFTVVVTTGTAIPGGSGNFASLGNPSVSGGMVAFFGADASWNEGIYAGDGAHPLAVVADTHTAIPGGSGNFTAFTGSWAYPPPISFSGQSIVFFGAGAGGQQGIYVGGLGQPALPLADLNTAIPGGSGNFTTFTTSAGFPSSPINGKDAVVFWAGGAAGQQGIYQFPSNLFYPSSPVKIADLNTAIPGGMGNFTDFVGNAASPVGPVASGGNVAFRGAGAGGVIGLYARLNGTLLKVADNTTPMPGGLGMFIDFAAVSLSGNVVAFAASGANGQMGIYASAPSAGSYPTDPMKVIDLNDTLDGKTITGLKLGAGGLSGDPLAFTATFSDGSQGVYLVPVVADVEITAVARAGNDFQLTHTAPAGHDYSVLATTDLANGPWTDLGMTNQGNGSVIQVTVTNAIATTPVQFFRVEQGQ